MRSLIALICVVGVLLLGASAWAAMSGPLTVRCQNGSKIASWSYNWTPGTMSYTLAAPVTLRCTDGTTLGTLKSLSCGMNADPFLTLNFAVQAVGNANFFLDSGVLPFAPIDPAFGFATAATTLTADGNAATFTGLFAGGKAYEATYNGGIVFADLDGPFNAPANDSATENERFPAAGFAPIVGPVSSMRAQWSFNLTDGDGASGTSRFEIQPVPDANTLALAFAGAAPLLGCAIRRRRRA